MTIPEPVLFVLLCAVLNDSVSEIDHAEEELKGSVEMAGQT